MQLVLRYASADPADVISDLLTDYAGIGPDFIPLSAWLAGTAASLHQVYTATIPEPTAVGDLNSEIIKQAALALWWDDVDQLIKLLTEGDHHRSGLFTEEDTIAGSIRSKEQPEKRIFKVLDATGQALAYVYARESEHDAGTAKVLTTDEARRIAANIAKLPKLLAKN